MNVLGLKAAGHDVGAALIRSDGSIVAIAEERLSRIKYSDGTFPRRSILYCLEALNLKPEEIDLIAVDPTVVNKAQWLRSEDLLKKEAGDLFPNARIVTVNHHDAHAAHAFFCSPFEEAAILVYDGSGELIRSHLGVIASETETLYRGEGNTITQIHKTLHAKSARNFPYTSGIGRLYALFSKEYLGFGPHNEGKMMGLAGYGDDSFLKEHPFEEFVTERHGELLCNANIVFKAGATPAEKLRRASLTRLPKIVYWGVRMRYMRLRDKALRAFTARSGESPFVQPNIFKPVYLKRPARGAGAEQLPDRYYSSVAYAVQKIFERFAIALGRHLREVTQSDNLCVAGGCALNIDANRNFITEVGFKNIFVQPASSDCGIALGCALWGYHAVLGQPRFWEMKNASLGRPYTQQEVKEAVEARKGEIEYRVATNVAQEAAALLADGQILGWFQGGSEYGPRALGNRSILCDARDAQMKDTLNARVKHREMWRPFATSILAERLQDWFDLTPNVTTAFMLLAAPIHQHKREEVPAIVHVDGTCRMQTLTKEANGVYYDLVKEFEKKTGVPLLLNTSFNLGGDPIVESPADAIDTFLQTDMDYLVLENTIIKKKGVMA